MPQFFKTPEAFRDWLAENHQTAGELWVGYYKKATGIPSITWPQSVDQAICFGWIDGIRKRVDEERYKIRFTPRRRGSIWSAVNIEKAEAMIKGGQMQPAGLKAYQDRKAHKSKVYAYEQKATELSPEYEAQLQANAAAWEYYSQKLAPSCKKASIHWVMSAKREETRQKRLQTLIESCGQGLKIPHLRR